MKDLTVEMRIEGNRTYVQLGGDLCSLDALNIKDSLHSSVGEKETLIIDLHEVERIDLTGLNALIMTQVRLRKKASNMLLLAPDDHALHELLHLTKFHDQVEVKQEDELDKRSFADFQKVG